MTARRGTRLLRAFSLRPFSFTRIIWNSFRLDRRRMCVARARAGDRGVLLDTGMAMKHAKRRQNFAGKRENSDTCERKVGARARARTYTRRSCRVCVEVIEIPLFFWPRWFFSTSHLASSRTWYANPLTEGGLIRGEKRSLVASQAYKSWECERWRIHRLPVEYKYCAARVGTHFKNGYREEMELAWRNKNVWKPFYIFIGNYASVKRRVVGTLSYISFVVKIRQTSRRERLTHGLRSRHEFPYAGS